MLNNLGLLLGTTDVCFLPEDNNSLGALSMGCVPDLYPGGQPTRDTQSRVRSRLASIWGGKLSPVEGLDFDRMLAGARNGTVKAMWIMGSDPASDCRLASDALGRVPFLVVQDLFLTDTASLAEVVLPAASFAETTGSFMNLTGRLQVVQPAKRPPGQAQPDWWIIAQLARQMVDSRQQRTWEYESAAAILNEISKVVTDYRGLDYSRMGSLGWQPTPPEATIRRTFARLTAQSAVPAQDPDYPFLFVAGKILFDRGTLLAHSEGVEGLVPEPFVLVHPGDASALGLADGDPVSVVSATGRLRLGVKVACPACPEERGDESVVPGVVYAPANLTDAPLSVLYDDCWTLPYVRLER